MAAYDTTNIFARIIRGELPCHRVYEDARTLAVMDIMPRGPGHTLVVPKAAARNLLDIAPDELTNLILVAQRVGKAAKLAFNADGLTVAQYSEAAGGQMVFHIHFHVLPRFDGKALNPHGGPMEKPEVLAQNALKISEALANLP